MLRTCETCPSYLTDSQDIKNHFGKVTGAPMCARYGHALGREGQDEQARSAVLVSLGSECDGWGMAKPGQPEHAYSVVAIPDPEVADRGQQEGSPLGSCNGCENLLSADATMAAYGWALPLCKARGILIHQPRFTATNCDMGIAGSQSQDPGEMTLLPRYARDFRIDSKVAASAYMAAYGADVDPSEYESDAKVSDEDRRCGIRAWRKVTDPKGNSESVYLPIFDESHFSEEERALVPRSGDEEHPENYLDYAGIVWRFAVESVVLGETMVLIANPGIGKTEGARHLAWLMRVPFYRFSCHAKMDPEDFMGTVQFTDGLGTHFVPGRYPLAYTATGVICVDEPNAAPPDVWQALRPTLDNSKQLVIDSAPGAPRFTKGMFSFPVMAMNPPWDVRNTGIADLAMADANRLSPMVIEIPPPEIEREIIRRHCETLDGYAITDKVLDTLISIATDIRHMEEFPDFWGIRQQVKVARKTRFYPMEEAFMMASLNFYEPDIREVVLQSVRMYTE